MIVITHKNNKCVKAYYLNSKTEISVTHIDIVDALFGLSDTYKDAFIIWCHSNVEPYVLFENFQNICSHHLIMASYNTADFNYILDQIGYVDRSPFINIKKNVKYPTWLMSTCVGVIHSKTLQKFDVSVFKGVSFDYTLNSIAKQGQVEGLFCYSLPTLLKVNHGKRMPNKASTFILFKFVKQHYKTRWLLILFFNYLIYEKRILIFPLVKAIFASKIEDIVKLTPINFDSDIDALPKNYDVLIPTIGRKAYLFNVLKDLAKQTKLPNAVIIIEQNPNKNAISDLEYINKEVWPFKIKHQFIHQTGACNARNLGLNEVESTYIFMADDDIRIEADALETALNDLEALGVEAVTLSCLRKGEQEFFKVPFQWFTFGSGCSIISKHASEKIIFDSAFEFGFGEDSDFGMQLRNLGADIAYLPHVQLLHIKAPIGGFRTVFQRDWESDSILPKPSPTVMLSQLKHQSTWQINGYRTLLFFKFYRRQPIKNPITYIRQMNLRWDRSIFWAQVLIKNSNK